MEFRRESRGGKTIYYDVELVRGSPSFLKLLQRCHSLAEESDRLKNLLSLEQVKAQSLEAEKHELASRLQHGQPASFDAYRGLFRTLVSSAYTVEKVPLLRSSSARKCML